MDLKLDREDHDDSDEMNLQLVYFNLLILTFYKTTKNTQGAQWLSGRVLD